MSKKKKNLIIGAVLIISMTVLWVVFSQDNEKIMERAKQGDAYSQYKLGRMYYFGEGVAEDKAKAAEWVRKSAVQGDVWAQFGLGSMYYDGEGVAQDYRRAYMWFDLAAASGDIRAANNRDLVAEKITADQIAQAQEMAAQCQASEFKDC